MAYDIVCKYCGHCEGAHADLARHETEADREECLDDIDGSRQVAGNYSVSLEYCEGYSPEDAEKAERIRVALRNAASKQPLQMKGWRQEQEL